MRDIHGATVPAKYLTCPSGCPFCVTHPGHQAEAHQRGVAFGAAMRPVNPAKELAFVDARLQDADRLAVPFLTGIREVLAGTVTA